MSEKDDLHARLMKLETEFLYFKWIIPAAISFVGLMVLVFWGIERGEISDRVRKALDQSAVSDVTRKLSVLLTDAQTSMQNISDLEKSSQQKSAAISDNTLENSTLRDIIEHNKNLSTSKFQSINTKVEELKSQTFLIFPYIEVTSIKYGFSELENGSHFHFEKEELNKAIGRDFEYGETFISANLRTGKIGKLLVSPKGNPPDRRYGNAYGAYDQVENRKAGDWKVGDKVYLFISRD